MKPMVVLMRHGQTEWNKTSRLMSRTNLPMSAEGIASCKQVAALNRGISFKRIISSPLVRAVQTAEIMAEACRGASLQVDEALREVDFGQFEGHTGRQLKQSPLGPAYLRWQMGESEDIGGAESWAAAARRAEEAFSRVGFEDGITLIVAHGYICRILVASAVLKMPLVNVRALRFDNGRFAAVESEHGLNRLTAFNVVDLNGVQDDSPTS
jgi:broad specificity phosphatase PhoE